MLKLLPGETTASCVDATTIVLAPSSLYVVKGMFKGQNEHRGALGTLRRFVKCLTLNVLATLSQVCFAQSLTPITVVEYFNSTLNAYFITGRSSEQSDLDASPYFLRTGMSFQALSTNPVTGGAGGICRFYVALATPHTSTHFYGRQGVDCESLRSKNLSGFTWEGFDFAFPSTPTSANVCPNGTKPIYRSFRAASGGVTPNHRYSSDPTSYASNAALGFVGEGTVGCTTAATPATLGAYGMVSLIPPVAKAVFAPCQTQYIGPGDAPGVNYSCNNHDSDESSTESLTVTAFFDSSPSTGVSRISAQYIWAGIVGGKLTGYSYVVDCSGSCAKSGVIGFDRSRRQISFNNVALNLAFSTPTVASTTMRVSGTLTY